MKRKLQIEFYQVINDLPVCTHKIICGHLDACKSITILSDCTVHVDGLEFHEEEVSQAEQIDHFNIVAGLITIYYKNGSYMEISRL